MRVDCQRSLELFNGALFSVIIHPAPMRHTSKIKTSSRRFTTATIRGNFERIEDEDTLKGIVRVMDIIV